MTVADIGHWINGGGRWAPATGAIKSIMQRWPESMEKGAEFVMPTAK